MEAGDDRAFLSAEPTYKALKEAWQDWGHKLNLTHLFNTDPCRFKNFRYPGFTVVVDNEFIIMIIHTLF